MKLKYLVNLFFINLIFLFGCAVIAVENSNTVSNQYSQERNEDGREKINLLRIEQEQIEEVAGEFSLERNNESLENPETQDKLVQKDNNTRKEDVQTSSNKEKRLDEIKISDICQMIKSSASKKRTGLSDEEVLQELNNLCRILLIPDNAFPENRLPGIEVAENNNLEDSILTEQSNTEMHDITNTGRIIKIFKRTNRFLQQQILEQINTLKSANLLTQVCYISFFFMMCANLSTILFTVEKLGVKWVIIPSDFPELFQIAPASTVFFLICSIVFFLSTLSAIFYRLVTYFQGRPHLD